MIQKFFMDITHQTVILIERFTALGTRLTEPTRRTLAIATTHRYCQDSRVYKQGENVNKFNVEYFILH